MTELIIKILHPTTAYGTVHIDWIHKILKGFTSQYSLQSDVVELNQESMTKLES